MALQGPIPITFEQAFPHGCFLVGQVVDPVRVAAPPSAWQVRREAGHDLAIHRVHEPVRRIIVPSDGHHLTSPRQPGQRLGQHRLEAPRFDGHAPLTDLDDADIVVADPCRLPDLDTEFMEGHLPPWASGPEASQHLGSFEPAKKGHAENLAKQILMVSYSWRSFQPTERNEGIGHHNLL